MSDIEPLRYVGSPTRLQLFFGLALSISALTATQASADATLDRIKRRGTLAVGVILSGAPFGYIDPKTQAQKGFNLDIAKALADDLGVKLETVTVTIQARSMRVWNGCGMR